MHASIFFFVCQAQREAGKIRPMQKTIVGIDEAGRGPLAGPVIAAAITVLGNPKSQDTNSKQFSSLKDSKLLSPRQREIIYAELYQNPEVIWGIGKVGEKTIDKINIYQATRLAMRKAVLSLERKLYKHQEKITEVHNSYGRRNDVISPIIDSLIVDGNMLLDLPIRQKAVIKADATILQCMAASIVAKVTRDRLMRKMHQKYPLYGFDRHKGYGTAYHLEMLKLHGPCDIHRLSFAPCQPKT